MENEKSLKYSKIAGNTYESKINDLHLTIKEKRIKKEDTKDDINDMIEVMAEYEEWKKWAKKEVKRRSAIIWGNNQKYKPLRQVIY